MTVEEIFFNVLSHSVKGLMFHDQISLCFDFLNLEGYKKCHLRHFMAESQIYEKLQHFYVERYQKLPPTITIDDPKIIPALQYKHTKKDVDANTKKSAIKDLLNKQIEQEKSTQEILCNAYTQLQELHDPLAARYVSEIIDSNALELTCAQNEQINLENLNYDLTYIIGEQKLLCEKYKKEE